VEEDKENTPNNLVQSPSHRTTTTTTTISTLRSPLGTVSSRSNESKFTSEEAKKAKEIEAQTLEKITHLEQGLTFFFFFFCFFVTTSWHQSLYIPKWLARFFLFHWPTMFFFVIIASFGPSVFRNCQSEKKRKWVGARKEQIKARFGGRKKTKRKELCYSKLSRQWFGTCSRETPRGI